MERFRYNCRVCWNSQGWVYPAGEASRLESRTYVAKHGFGHEEWLFNYEWMFNELKYGHLQPVSPSRRRLAGKHIDLFLYAFGPDRQVYAVGTIDNVRILQASEAELSLAEFRRRGWLDEMADDLQALNVDPSPILTAPGPSTFNVAFDPELVQLRDPIEPIDKTDPARPKVTRYILTRSAGVPEGRSTRPRGSTVPTKTVLSSFRRPVSGTQVDWRHTRLQNALHDYLSHLGHEAMYERHRVDLTLRLPDGDILLELKTAPTVRACVRQALGQLLEYAYYEARQEQLRAIVVVGRAPPCEADLTYLRFLRTDRGLPVEYWQFTVRDGTSSVRPFPDRDSVWPDVTPKISSRHGV